MRDMLVDSDFTHPLPVLIHPNNILTVSRVNLKDKKWVDYHLKPKQNEISLTGASHTMDLYRNLKFGWRPAPKNIWSDLYMWRQIFLTPNIRLSSSDLSTMIKLPSSARIENDLNRKFEIETWSIIIKNPDFFDLWQKKVLPL
jgi:hypothetical protein